MKDGATSEGVRGVRALLTAPPARREKRVLARLKKPGRPAS